MLEERDEAPVVEQIASVMRAGLQMPIRHELRAELLSLPVEARRRAGLRLVMLSSLLIREDRDRHRGSIIEIARLLDSIEASLKRSGDAFETTSYARLKKLLAR